MLVSIFHKICIAYEHTHTHSHLHTVVYIRRIVFQASMCLHEIYSHVEYMNDPCASSSTLIEYVY